MEQEKENCISLEDPNNEITNPTYIGKIKTIFNKDYQKILPKEIEKIKQMNEALYSKYGELSKVYNSTLASIHSQNNQIKNKAKEYFMQYQQVKKDLFHLKTDLLQKRKNNQTEDELIANESKRAINNFESYQEQNKALKNALGITQEEPEKETPDDKDIKILLNILQKLNNLGVDVVSAAGQNEDDIKKIANLLKSSETNVDNNGIISNNDVNMDDINDKNDEFL